MTRLGRMYERQEQLKKKSETDLEQVHLTLEMSADLMKLEMRWLSRVKEIAERYGASFEDVAKGAANALAENINENMVWNDTDHLIISDEEVEETLKDQIAMVTGA